MMHEYFEPIRTALRVFPWVVVTAVLPLMVIHYRRYGRLQAGRSLVLYSFFFYALAALALVILPLPERTPDFLARYEGTRVPRLTPFAFVGDIAGEVPDAEGLGLVIAVLGSRAFLQVFFNFLLLLPLGVYLRYFFKVKLFTAAFAIAATTLGFELLQLTGLLGLYPCAYRLFDVDDLLLNTAGGVVGFAIAAPLSRVLPSVEPQLPVDPDRVTLARRVLAIWVDLIASGAAVIALMIVPSPTVGVPGLLFLGVAAADFLLLPLITGGATVGQAVLRIRIVAADGSRLRRRQCVLRGFLLYAPPVAAFLGIVIAGALRNAFGFAGAVAELFICLALVGAYALVPLIRVDRRSFQGLLSGTRLSACCPVSRLRKPDACGSSQAA